MNKNILEKECITFSQYLIRQTPDRYVIEKYCAAHESFGNLHPGPNELLDRILLRLPGHPVFLRLMDAYTLLFARRSLLRKKWILLIAILESCEPTSLYFDQPDPGTKPVLIATMAWNGLIFVSCLAFSIVLLGPLAIAVRTYQKLFQRSK